MQTKQMVLIKHPHIEELEPRSMLAAVPLVGTLGADGDTAGGAPSGSAFGNLNGASSVAALVSAQANFALPISGVNMATLNGNAAPGTAFPYVVSGTSFADILSINEVQSEGMGLFPLAQPFSNQVGNNGLRYGGTSEFPSASANATTAVGQMAITNGINTPGISSFAMPIIGSQAGGTGNAALAPPAPTKEAPAEPETHRTGAPEYDTDLPGGTTHAKLDEESVDAILKQLGRGSRFVASDDANLFAAIR